MSRRALFASLVFAAVATAQGRESAKFTVDGEVTCTALDPKDYGSLLGFAHGGLTVFPVTWEKVIQLFPFNGHRKAVTGGAFTPDGDMAVTSSMDGTLRCKDRGLCKCSRRERQEGPASRRRR